MKKLATGFMTMALALGLAACQDSNETAGTTGEAQDLEQLESPAAGEQAPPMIEEENRTMDPGMQGMDQGLDTPQQQSEPGTQTIEPDVEVIPPEEQGQQQR